MDDKLCILKKDKIIYTAPHCMQNQVVICNDHVNLLELTRLILFITLSPDYDITLIDLTLSGFSDKCHTIERSDKPDECFFSIDKSRPYSLGTREF